MPTDTELAKTFVSKITRNDMLVTTLENQVETMLGAHRTGEKSTEKNALKAFIDGLPDNFDATTKRGVAKQVVAYVAKHGRFTYKAAFAKKAPKIAKILGIAKKGDAAKVDSEIASLYSDMRASGEIPKTIKFGSFNTELRAQNKNLAFDAKQETAPETPKKISKSDMKKYNFNKFMTDNKIDKKDVGAVHDLAISVWNKGEKNKATNADAEWLILNNGLKAKPAALIEGVKRAMLQTYL